jgi:glycine/D-amino acid oxidase-like deaminating enzyme
MRSSAASINIAQREFDDAIVSAGVMGLARAYHLAMRGSRVVVFERNPQAACASIRNFGMIWPIGQPAGVIYELARPAFVRATTCKLAASRSGQLSRLRVPFELTQWRLISHRLHEVPGAP